MISFLVVWAISTLILIFIEPQLGFSPFDGSVALMTMAGAGIALAFFAAQQERRINELEERVKQLESPVVPSDEGAVSESD